MFSPRDAPSKTAPGNGRSTIDFGALEFEAIGLDMAYPGAVTYVEVAVFESSHFSELGVDVPGAAVRQYCCTPWVANRTGCHPSRGLVRGAQLAADAQAAAGAQGTGTGTGVVVGGVGGGGGGGPRNWTGTVELMRVPVPLVPGRKVTLGDVGFEPNGHEPYHKFKVRQSGLYTLLLANCDGLNAVGVRVGGHTAWRNPYGFLPGEAYGMLPLTGVLLACYASLAMAWGAACAWHRRDSGGGSLQPVQAWVGGVLLLGAAEFAAKVADYAEWNEAGERPTAALAAGLVLGATKRAVSRVLVVAVCLGWAVVKPHLGTALPRAVCLGAAYWLLALTKDLVEGLPGARQRSLRGAATAWAWAWGGGGSSGWDNGLGLALALVDAGFCAWTLHALRHTLAYLGAKREAAKRQLFTRLRAALVTGVAVSVAWTGFAAASHNFDGWEANHWRSQWAVGAVWEGVYLGLLAATAFLWMPSKNAPRYAYSTQLTTVDPDDLDGGRGGLSDDDDDDFDDVGYNGYFDGFGGDGAVDDEYGGALDDGGAAGLPRRLGGGGGGALEMAASTGAHYDRPGDEKLV